MKYEVVIIGAGPGGLSAAIELAKNNIKTIVLEQNKIIGPKVCAGGLTAKDFELGIDKKIADRFFKRVLVHTPLFNDEIVDKKPFIATIERKTLGQYMLKKAKKAKAKVITAEVIEVGKDFVKTKNGQKINFDYLIGADGSNSIVRRWLGLEKEREVVALQYLVKKEYKEMELFLNVELFGPGYAWIFPHKNFTSIGCGTELKLIDSKQLQINFQKWLKENKIKIKEDNKYESWFINCDYRGHDFGRYFLVGDAGGFASNLTGEGMYFAMVSGIEVARKIIKPNYEQIGIKKILGVKEKHEKVLALLDFNKTLTKLEYETLALIFKNRHLDRFLIDNFG